MEQYIRCDLHRRLSLFLERCVTGCVTLADNSALHLVWEATERKPTPSAT